jgi:hypothetical protein
VGYNGRGFLPLWDITEEFFSTVGYNREGFPPLWDTTVEDIFRFGIQQRKISGWQTIFFQWNPQRRTIFFRCIPQWKIFSSIVGYNGRGFFPLCDTTEEVFFRIIQRRMKFLNFKCLSLPSNKNLVKICYLNSQTNPWKEVKMENYMVHLEKFFFSIVGYNAAEIFLIIQLK